jgi:hypothetical protein
MPKSDYTTKIKYILEYFISVLQKPLLKRFLNMTRDNKKSIKTPYVVGQRI